MHKIDLQDITVIVQGAVDPIWTERSLKSIRRQLPKATIILSTWQSAPIGALNGLYDKLILNDGDVFVFHNEIYVSKTKTRKSAPQNINKQIKSTLSGLKMASTKYALKLRSDMLIEGLGFLRAFERYGREINAESIVAERIVVGCHTTRVAFSRSPLSNHHCPFHISDFSCFGRTSDLLMLWSRPFMASDAATYFHDEAIIFNGCRVKNYMRFLPEQYLWLGFVREKQPAPMEHFFDSNEQIIERYYSFIGHNLIVLNQERLQISLPKQRRFYINRYFDFTFADWRYAYAAYFKKAPYLSILLNLQRILIRLWWVLLSTPRLLGGHLIGRARALLP